MKKKTVEKDIIKQNARFLTKKAKEVKVTVKKEDNKKSSSTTVKGRNNYFIGRGFGIRYR